MPSELGRDAVDLALSVARSPLEHHVLEEVRDAGLFLDLVARADSIEEQHRDDRIGVSLGQDHSHSVAQTVLADERPAARERRVGLAPQAP